VIHRQRVIFGDTDQMGVVYYANYLRYFEAARVELLASRGRSQRDLEAWGVALPVAEAHCRYRRPARYEDMIDIDIRVAELRGASVRFAYEVRRDGELLADGYTVHACVGPDGRMRRIPDELRALFEAPPAT
jgi:acyl-CoA thioester hydrolase